MDRLLLSLGIIFFSLSAGYACRCLAQTRPALFTPDRMLLLRQKIQIVSLFALFPLAAMLSLWAMPRPDGALLLLPFLGIAAWSLGGALALLYAGLRNLDGRRTGSLYCCGTFSNIGAVGTLVCVLFHGEGTIALAALYRLCEELFYFSAALPIARRYAPDGGVQGIGRRKAFSPALCIALGALSLGILLNLCHVRRPHFCGNLATVLTISSTVLLLFSIGLGLRISRLACYTREGLAVCLIKFLCVPAAVIGIAKCAGLGGIDNGLPLKVVAVLASMPVAMNALIPPSLFNLDLDLANACWLFSTLALPVVLPVLLVILPLL